MDEPWVAEYWKAGEKLARLRALGELPPEPDCPSCDGTGWYVDERRCPCWQRRLILEGPPE